MIRPKKKRGEREREKQPYSRLSRLLSPERLIVLPSSLLAAFSDRRPSRISSGSLIGLVNELRRRSRLKCIVGISVSPILPPVKIVTILLCTFLRIDRSLERWLPVRNLENCRILMKTIGRESMLKQLIINNS